MDSAQKGAEVRKAMLIFRSVMYGCYGSNKQHSSTQRYHFFSENKKVRMLILDAVKN